LARRIVLLIVVMLAVLVGLLLDLRANGLVWRALRTATGEDEPLRQVYGFAGYLSNLTRRQPVIDSPEPLNHTVDNPIGINTFLEQEVEPAKRERALQMIRDAGIAWIRQQFRWDDIEVDGRGQFTDSRNDINGDGVRDTIDAWAKYDNIVQLAEKYGLRIIARLDSPPRWSQPDDALPGYAPPADFADFARFAATVSARYRDRITYYQIWNEPNIYPEWGDQSVDPEAYTDLLCRAHDAIKVAHPQAVIISGALAPTVALTGRDANEIVFLQRMYAAGAARCFDILGAQGYGLFSGPQDRRMRAVTITYAHPLWLRDQMIANGDAAKPIWISEMAWNPVPDDPAIADLERFGRVTDVQAAHYAVEALDRARREWPFVGVISYWFFKRASDAEKNQSFYYFRMVEPDFTPRPVYDAIKAYAARTYPAPP
jgi:hypothetical protein